MRCREYGSEIMTKHVAQKYGILYFYELVSVDKAQPHLVNTVRYN